jgi:cell division transport system permease protein
MWLRLHRFALADAFSRMRAQPIASAVSVLALGLALALPLLGWVLVRTAASATSQLDADPHVNVYLALDAADADVRRVAEALRASPDAASVRFIPRTQAFEELKATTHLADVLASLDRNPLPHAFTVKVRNSEPAALQSAKAAWSRLPKVDQVAADFEWSSRLARWLRFSERVVEVLGILLAAVVLFIVVHLIRLQVVTRREEIDVSRLIGATPADVRRRFLYHGALQGALAGVVALAVTLGAAEWMTAEVRALTPAYVSDLKINSIDPAGFLAILAVAAGLGFLGAWLAVDRELRAFGRDR